MRQKEKEKNKTKQNKMVNNAQNLKENKEKQLLI